MMKNRLFNLLALTLMITTVTFAQQKSVDVANSKLTWKGYKVTGSHEGNISLKEGALTFKGDKLKSGNFVVDMTTMTVTDIQGEYAGKLKGHLMSDDFFGVKNHQTATLSFDKAKSKGNNTYAAKGKITIKGITQPINFDVMVKGNQASIALKIDRTKFGIKYKSKSFFDNLKDKAIYDEFDLTAELKF